MKWYDRLSKKVGATSLQNPVTGYLFVLPQLLLFSVFVLYPTFLGFRLSLFDISYVQENYVGLEHYLYLFKDPVFIRSVINTLIYVGGIVGLTILFSLFVATAVFDKNPRYVTFIRGAYYLPVMLSIVVMSIIWNFFLNPTNGLMAYLLNQVGVKGFNPLGQARSAVIVIVFVTFIGNVGQAIILYIASMIGIPSDYFEAADIDGATRFEKIRHIIIPLSRSTTIYLVITNIVAVLKIFTVIQLMTGGGPNNASVSLMYLLYQHAFDYNNTGIAAAIGVIMFIVAVCLAIPQLRLFLKDEHEQ